MTRKESSMTTTLQRALAQAADDENAQPLDDLGVAMEKFRSRPAYWLPAEGYTKAHDILLEYRLSELLAEKKRLQRQLKTIERAIRAHNTELPTAPWKVNQYMPPAEWMRDEGCTAADRKMVYLQAQKAAADEKWHHINQQLYAIGQATHDQLTEHCKLLGKAINDPVTILAETNTLLIDEGRARKRIRERKAH
jgi:hypothetical protein